MTRKEFHRAMPALGLEVSKQDIDDLFSSWDADGCGKLDFKELRRLLKPRTDTRGGTLRAPPKEPKAVVAKGKSTKQIQEEAAHKVDHRLTAQQQAAKAGRPPSQRSRPPSPVLDQDSRVRAVPSHVLAHGESGHLRARVAARLARAPSLAHPSHRARFRQVDAKGGSVARPQAKRPELAGPSKPINATAKVDTKGPAGGKREARNYSTLQTPDSRRSVRRRALSSLTQPTDHVHADPASHLSLLSCCCSRVI